MRDVTITGYTLSGAIAISTHTPHAGRDPVADRMHQNECISTHTPHAGRDAVLAKLVKTEKGFLLTRPMRDVTVMAYSDTE